jgi:hypothetical protein
MKSRLGLLSLACSLALALAACGGDDDEQAPSAADGSMTDVATSPTAQVTTPTPDPATAVLFGEWHTEISADDKVTLTLRDGRYAIRRGPAAGTGSLSATASEAVFANSNLCDGDGVYTWSIEDGALTFTSATSDPCGGRSEVLDGKTYTK